MIGPLVIAVIAIVLTVIAVLCAVGVIRRNPVVGIRIPSFFESDNAWKAGHRAAVAPMAAAAAVCVGLTIVAAAVPTFGGPTAVIVSTAVLLTGVIVGAAIGSRALRRSGQ